MKSPTLLLVDDEPAILSSLRRAFHGCAYRILTAQKATDALSLLRAEPVDIILTDHLMPGMTGIQLLREVRRQTPGVFRILVSAHVDAESILSASNDGVIQRFIEKPFEEEEVRAVVGEFLDQRQVRERRDFLEALIESCPDPIVLTDEEGFITYVNGPGGETYGDSPERLVGRNVSEILADGGKEIEAIRAGLKGGGRIRSHETTILGRRGPVPISISVSPLLDVGGGRQGFFCIAKDISAQKHAEAELRRRNRELAALNTFALATMGHPNPDQILDRAIAALLDVAEIDAAALYLYDAEEGCFRLRAQRGFPDRLSERMGLISDSIYRRLPNGGLFVAGSGEARHRTPEWEALAGEGFSTGAYTPILWNEEVNALLVIAWRDVGPLDASFERLLPAIGAMAGMSMENSVLFARTQSEAEHAALLHQIAGTASSSLELDEVLDRAVRWTASALRVDQVAVALFREDLSAVEACRGLDGSLGPTDWNAFGLDPACLTHHRSQGTLVARDAARDPVIPKCQLCPFLQRGKAFVEVPLIHQDRLLGVLHVSASWARRWEWEEIQLIERVGLELANSVRHAQTLQELRRTLDDLETAKSAVERQAEDTSALYRLSQALTHVLDIDALVSLTAESVLAATRARAVGVIVKHEERARTALLVCGEVEDEETEALRAAIAEAAGTSLGGPLFGLAQAPIQSTGACSTPSGPAAAGDVPDALDLMITFRIAGREAGLFWIRPHCKQPFHAWEEKLVKTIALQTSSTLERLLDAIEAQHRKIQAMVEGMSEPVVLLDDAFSLVCMNASARRLLDLEDAQARFDPARIRPLSLRKLFLRAARHPDEALLEEDVVFERPRTRVYHVALSPVSDAGGRRIGTAAMFHDVTARHEVEQMKSEFVAHVSHELRTPLTSVKEAIALLLDGVVGAISEGQREFLEMADRETNRLVRLINDVLELSRIESSRVHLNRVPVSPRAIAESVVASFEIVAQRTGVRLSLNAPTPIPLILVDPDRLTQILVILVDNAIKFTPPGGAVTISLADAPEALDLQVADTGCGIPESELDRIFEKFHQVPAEGIAPARGTGLGLSIAKGLAEMHRGTIRVDSRLGEGTTFAVTLPRIEASGAVEEYLEAQVIRGRAEGSGFGLIAVALRTEGGGAASEVILSRAAALIRKDLYRSGDRLFLQGNVRLLIVLERTNGPGARAVQARLDRVLGEALPDAVVEWSSAAYPEQGITPAELLEAVGSVPPASTGPKMAPREGQV